MASPSRLISGGDPKVALQRGETASGVVRRANGGRRTYFNALSLDEEVNVKLTRIDVRGGFEVLSGTKCS